MLPKPLDTVMRSPLKVFPDVACRTVMVLCNLRMFYRYHSPGLWSTRESCQSKVSAAGVMLEVKLKKKKKIRDRCSVSAKTFFLCSINWLVLIP